MKFGNRLHFMLSTEEDMMFSHVDLYRAAHLMMHEYGNNAELEALRYADQMLAWGDRDELLLWFAIRWTIARMRHHGFTTGLPN
jgi:hypothetical protein